MQFSVCIVIFFRFNIDKTKKNVGSDTKANLVSGLAQRYFCEPTSRTFMELPPIGFVIFVPKDSFTNPCWKHIAYRTRRKELPVWKSSVNTARSGLRIRTPTKITSNDVSQVDLLLVIFAARKPSTNWRWQATNVSTTKIVRHLRAAIVESSSSESFGWRNTKQTIVVKFCTRVRTVQGRAIPARICTLTRR